MSNYTAELRTIIDNGFDIFDFTYNRTNESRAILSDEELETGFIKHFYFREVGFETLERFKQRLETCWKESLGEFDSLLVEYSKPINVLSNAGTDSENTIIFNDTPQSALDYGEQSNHATNITHGTSKNKGYAGQTEIELLEKYHDKIKDIQTEFYNSFENLFMQIF